MKVSDGDDDGNDRDDDDNYTTTTTIIIIIMTTINDDISTMTTSMHDVNLKIFGRFVQLDITTVVKEVKKVNFLAVMEVVRPE